MSEQRTQLNPGSGGSYVRVQENTELQPDGTLATVETERVALADPWGQDVDVTGALREIATLLRSIDDSLKQLLFRRGGL